jgi:hypothetical protein
VQAYAHRKNGYPQLISDPALFAGTETKCLSFSPHEKGDLMMTMRDLMPRPWQPYLGAGLFALSLAVLAVVAPNLVAIACVLGGGTALALFGLTRSRFALILMTLLMLAISGCGLLAALILHRYVLLPVGAIQILAIFLLESREARAWMEGVPALHPGHRRPA